MKAWNRFLYVPIAGLAIVLGYGGGALPAGATVKTVAADQAVDAPTSTAAAIEAARKDVADGKLDEAVRMLAKYVAAHPHELDAARYLGDLYYRQADLPSAERVFRDILHAAPNDRETHNRLGGIYAAEDRVTDAINEFTASLPTASNAYNQLVELHRRRGDLGSFVTQSKDLADRNPLEFVAQYNIGKIFGAERRFSDAAMYLERALDLAPQECNVLSALGDVYIDLGNPRRSFEYLNRCLYRDPDNYPALVNRADLYIELAQYDKARGDLEHAHRVRLEGPEALIDIGYLEDVAHNWRSAVSYYLRALSIDPLMREAYTDLGYDYDEHQLYALAEASYLKGLSISPNDGRLHYLLAVAYADQGKRSLALAEYQRAANSDEADVARAASRELSILLRG